VRKYLFAVAAPLFVLGSILVTPADAGVLVAFGNSGTGTFDSKTLTAPWDNVFYMEQPPPATSSIWDPTALGSRRIDALDSLTPGGNFVFSFSGPKWKTGGVTYTQNDLIQYDIGTDSYSLFWTPPGVSYTKNLNTLILPNNDVQHIIMSFRSAVTIGGKRYQPYQLLEWTPTAGYTLYFDAKAHKGPSVLRGAALDADGNLLVSGTSWSGHSSADIYRYDATAKTWSVYFDTAPLSSIGSKNIVYDFDPEDLGGAVPEPVSLTLLGIGGLALLRRRR